MLNTTTVVHIKTGILQQLLYSEVFAHPLTLEELMRFSKVEEAVSREQFQTVLASMEADDLVSCEGQYISVSASKEKIAQREIAAERANALFDKAVRVGTFIHKFPFVKGVGISGSLSKGILHSDGDFDFFIITHPERVWVARTLLILYKKLFLLNSRKYFCVNYFIDSDHLEIEEKNRFTAVEVATLIPVAGAVFDDFYAQNAWVASYFPQGVRTEFETRTPKRPIASRSIQSLMNKRFGDWCDKKAMAITFKRWKKKFGEFDREKFDLTMKTRRYVSKHHPNDFQNKVLQRYENLIREYSKKHAEMLKKHDIQL